VATRLGLPLLDDPPRADLLVFIESKGPAGPASPVGQVGQGSIRR
jgi:hypothetical protein